MSSTNGRSLVAARWRSSARSRRARALAAVLALLSGAALAAAAPALSAQEISARTGSSVVLGARAQIQYEASSDNQVPATFSIRRVWITIDGRVSERISGRVQFNANGGNVWEAYLQVTASDAFQVQIGQFKRAVSYFWLAANADLPVIERDARVTGLNHCPGVGGVCSYGQLTGSLGLDGYEPGILMTGRFAGGRMGYRFTVTNGEGLGRVDLNTRKSISGRVSTYFGERSRVSAILAMDETLDLKGENTLGVPAYGAEVEIGTWRNGPHLVVNALRGRNWKLSDEATFRAFQMMAFWYRALPEGAPVAGVEPMLRVSWADTDGEDPTGGRVAGRVVTPGFMVYLNGRNGLATNLDLYSATKFGNHWSLKVQAFMFF